MKKLFIIACIILLAFVATILLSKNFIVKNIITAGVRGLTSLELGIKSVNIGFGGSIDIKGLKLYNPSNFPDKLMVDMPRIYIDFDLPAFFKKKVHFKHIELNLKEFLVVKDKKGNLNLDSLKVVREEKEEKPAREKKQEEMPQFKIDVLKLKIGKVVFKDYSQGDKPQTKEFNINIDETYNNITDPNSLAKLIMAKAIVNTTITSLTGFDLNIIKEGISGTIKTTTGIATNVIDKTLDAGVKIGNTTKDVLKEGIEKTADTIKNILPLGQKDK